MHIGLIIITLNLNPFLDLGPSLFSFYTESQSQIKAQKARCTSIP